MPLPNYNFPGTTPISSNPQYIQGTTVQPQYAPYGTVLPQMNQTPIQPQANNGVIWVQGEAAAKAYPVAKGGTVLLMDSESNVFYLKSVDTSGMPQPLEVYEYKKIEKPIEDTDSKYATKEDLDKMMKRIEELFK